MAEPKDVRVRIEHLIERAQGDIVDASRQLADGISRETDRFVPPISEDIEHLVDDVFDFAERVMKGQRSMVSELVKSLNEQSRRAAEAGQRGDRAHQGSGPDQSGGQTGHEEEGAGQEGRSQEDDGEETTGEEEGRSQEGDGEESGPVTRVRDAPGPRWWAPRVVQLTCRPSFSQYGCLSSRFSGLNAPDSGSGPMRNSTDFGTLKPARI